MDQVFLQLIGKPQLNPAKIITVIAENFSFSSDQAEFLKATLAIPAVKQLPFESGSKRLVQVGPLRCDIAEQVQRDGWIVDEFIDTTSTDDICDRLQNDIQISKQSILFINDASRLLLSSSRYNGDPVQVGKNFLKLVNNWKLVGNHFVVILYQGACPAGVPDKFLRNLEYMSDAVIRTRSHKGCYFQAIWFQSMPIHRTLIPAKVETNYCTCKIGKSYWSSDLLCFYERQTIPKDCFSFIKIIPDYDTETSAEIDHKKVLAGVVDNETKTTDQPNQPNIEADEIDDVSTTLPYTLAQNPEQSRIFYYPDKNDDIDEDDPDNDLGI